MTPQDRIASYAKAFGKYPASIPSFSGGWLQGMWVLGNNYKGSSYYGSFPPGLLNRVFALFPDRDPRRVLHACSGSLRGVEGVTVDINSALRPQVCADIHILPFVHGAFSLIIADPPYSSADATHYGTPMVHRRKMIRELARVCAPGGYLAWLDTTLPMFTKAQWHWFGAIGVVRSTNHRVRLLSIFERQP